MLFTKQNLFPVSLLQVDVVCGVLEDVPYAVKQFGDVLGGSSLGNKGLPDKGPPKADSVIKNNIIKN
jgi:hypothetical protein